MHAFSLARPLLTRVCQIYLSNQVFERELPAFAALCCEQQHSYLVSPPCATARLTPLTRRRRSRSTFCAPLPTAALSARWRMAWCGDWHRCACVRRPPAVLLLPAPLTPGQRSQDVSAYVTRK